MHQRGQRKDFLAADLLAPTQRGEVLEGHLGLALGQFGDLVASRDPPGADLLTHLRQPRGLGGDGILQLLDAVARLVVDLEVPRQHVRELPLQMRVVQVRVLVGRTVGRHDHDPRGRADPESDAA